MRFSEGPTTEVSLTIRAPLSAVWEACTDPGLPVENSPELVDARWEDDDNPPGLGKRLLGTNRMGEREWSTVSTVVEWEPLKVWSYEVDGGGDSASQWWYRIDDHQDGTATLTQKVRLGPGKSGLTAAIERKPELEETIIERRLAYMAEAMRANLEAIEARAAS